jgi:chemotaxis protein methyltransferase CheR
MELVKKEFSFLQNYAKQVCGLVVPQEKDYLFKFRLGPLLEEYKLSGFEELSTKLKLGDLKIKEHVISALTTHETFFFRDSLPFDAFEQEILPWLESEQKTNKRPVKIWSAASSTGQEPYSLAMLIHQYCKTSFLDLKNISIMASDIAKDILECAQRGIYTQSQLERGPLNERTQF